MYIRPFSAAMTRPTATRNQPNGLCHRERSLTWLVDGGV